MRPALHIALLCTLVPAWATTLEKLSVDDMVQKSTAIVRGRSLGGWLIATSAMVGFRPEAAGECA